MTTKARANKIFAKFPQIQSIGCELGILFINDLEVPVGAWGACVGHAGPELNDFKSWLVEQSFTFDSVVEMIKLLGDNITRSDFIFRRIEMSNEEIVVKMFELFPKIERVTFNGRYEVSINNRVVPTDLYYIRRIEIPTDFKALLVGSEMSHDCLTLDKLLTSLNRRSGSFCFVRPQVAA